MKITKKKPLRPRGRTDEKRQSAKDAIRDAYANGPQREVQIIPAKRDLETGQPQKKLRVCAYCRVSTDEDTQASSYELQVQNYTKMIQENPEWEFAGIYADEGISGTSTLRREQFLAMIERCKAGEIDLIITKQVSRFARNVLDSLNYIFMLRKLDPPVGVYFETEKLNTLDRSSDMVITVLSLVAQSESEQKSNSLKWSFKRRRAQGLGIYPNWALLGYKGHDWEIDEDEADIVRTIYSLYLEGFSSSQVAEFLTKSGIPTVKGLPTWSSGSVLGILRNEKYCGDALCQKTVTVDLFTHKTVKNNGLETQYFDPATFAIAQERIEALRLAAEERPKPTRSAFTGKICCVKCGKNYKRGRHGDRVFWNCSTYLTKGSKFCRCSQIPEPLLYSITTEVLGLEEFDPDIFESKITVIEAHDDNTLVFCFTDGTQTVKRWQHRSRAESWTPEMRENARQRTAQQKTPNRGWHGYFQSTET